MSAVSPAHAACDTDILPFNGDELSFHHDPLNRLLAGGAVSGKTVAHTRHR